VFTLVVISGAFVVVVVALVVGGWVGGGFTRTIWTETMLDVLLEALLSLMALAAM
jgi:hypothetical protein